MKDVGGSGLKTLNAASPLKVLLINPMACQKKSCLSCHQWPETWELFSTVTPPADMYEAAMTILPTHFTLKKNLTAERFEFFCTKPINSGKTHDHWITKARTKVKDC